MSPSYRLKATNLFERPEEQHQELPRRIIFLSVEGNHTELDYLNYVERYRESLGIKASVHVEPLKRSKRDNLSAPSQVIELLEEYIQVRQSDILTEQMRKEIPTIYSDEFIEAYLQNAENIDSELKEEFDVFLKKAEFDLHYRKFLKDFQSNDDIFGIVIDRDAGNHLAKQINNIIEECKEKNYKCFLSTPCFEFWLLLHLVNIKEKHGNDLEKILKNEKISKKHTFTSQLVSQYAGHSKKIKEDIFKNMYLTNIDNAIIQAKEFETNLNGLVENLGSNLPELFVLLREI